MFWIASRVLALCLRQLSHDCAEHWGNPLLMVESFVDESRYRGTSFALTPLRNNLVLNFSSGVFILGRVRDSMAFSVP